MRRIGHRMSTKISFSRHPAVLEASGYSRLDSTLVPTQSLLKVVINLYYYIRLYIGPVEHQFYLVERQCVGLGSGTSH